MYGFFLPRHKRGVKPEADINNPFVITGRSLGEGGLINCKVVRQLHTIAQAEKIWPEQEAREDLSLNKLMKSSKLATQVIRLLEPCIIAVSEGLGFSLPTGRICYNSLIVDVSECFCRLSLDKLGH